MSLSLLTELSRFRPREDHETPHAWFRTLVPWVAPQAFLHIVFKPPTSELLSQMSSQLRFTQSVVELFAAQNGAMLFAGAMWIDGIVRTGQLLDRVNRFGTLPFDIVDANSVRRLDTRRYLVIGGYRFDGSSVCVDRMTGKVGIKQRSSQNVEIVWPSVERWILDELGRIGQLFTDDGHLIGVAEELAPPL